LVDDRSSADSARVCRTRVLLFVAWFAGIKFVGKPIVAREVDDQMRRMASV
jgi:hypothetical protein